MTKRSFGAILLGILLLLFKIQAVVWISYAENEKIIVEVGIEEGKGRINVPSGFQKSLNPLFTYRGEFEEGTIITLVAVPDPGWMFFGWFDSQTGRTISRNSTLTFIVSKNCTYTHYYKTRGYFINILADFIETTSMVWYFGIFVTSIEESGKYYRISTLSVPIGAECQYNLTVMYWFGEAQPVFFTFEEVPEGISVSLSPNPITPNGSGVLRVSASNLTSAGGYSLKIVGTRLGEGESFKTFSEDYKLHVIPPKIYSNITCILSNNSITSGGSVQIYGRISPAVSAEVTIRYSANGGKWDTLATVTSDSNGFYSYTWSNIPAGNYSLRAFWSGNDNYYWAYSPLALLNVKTPTPDFLISASQTSFIYGVKSGTLTNYETITITSINSFNEPVQLTVSGIPSGVTLTLDPQQVTPPPNGSTTSTLTISVSDRSTPGEYIITITGTSGTLTNKLELYLKIYSIEEEEASERLQILGIIMVIMMIVVTAIIFWQKKLKK